MVNWLYLYYNIHKSEEPRVSKIFGGGRLYNIYTVFQKKTPTHIIGYKLKNSCVILVIFDMKISHVIWNHVTA